MSDYLHSEDGKIHTRYSELAKCTAGQIDRVIAERKNPELRYESDDMAFGTERHETWAAESRITGLSAKVFPRVFQASYIEEEFVTELLPGVVVHSRPDLISLPEKTIVDYKTMVAPSYLEGLSHAARVYGKSRQLPFYTYQLGLNSILIGRLVYLIELWNKDRDTILGYCCIERTVNMSEIMKVLPWAKARISMLAAAMEESKV